MIPEVCCLGISSRQTAHINFNENHDFARWLHVGTPWQNGRKVSFPPPKKEVNYHQNLATSLIHRGLKGTNQVISMNHNHITWIYPQ